MTNDLSKTCEYCGKVFYKSNTRQTTKSFLTRKYCCLECASKAQGMARRSKKLGKYKKINWKYSKVCPQCGEEFWPHEHEFRSQFAKRKFCCHECADDSRRKKPRVKKIKPKNLHSFKIHVNNM